MPSLSQKQLLLRAFLNHTMGVLRLRNKSSNFDEETTLVHHPTNTLAALSNSSCDSDLALSHSDVDSNILSISNSDSNSHSTSESDSSNTSTSSTSGSSLATSSVLSDTDSSSLSITSNSSNSDLGSSSEGSHASVSSGSIELDGLNPSYLDQAHQTNDNTRWLNRARDFVMYMLQARVLFPNKVSKVSTLELILTDFWFNNPGRFRMNLRVLPATFDALLHHIDQHPIFYNNSNVPQFPPTVQLAVALYRFGHYGNAASVSGIAQWAGISEGSVVDFTRRVCVAILSLHDKVITWPDEARKEAAKAWVEQKSCAAWRDGFCMVDGSTIPLFQKPGMHGETYFDRKSRYSLNVQVISLPNLQVIDYSIGYTGSAHDSTAFQESRTFKDHHMLFPNGEFIWADSAYPVTTWSVAPFMRPDIDVSINRYFNFRLSQIRIGSEHAIGYLKGRFSSLRELRQQINSADDHLRALIWVKTCVVLHTLVLQIEEGCEDHQWVAEVIQQGQHMEAQDRIRVQGLHGQAAVVGVERNTGTPGWQFREDLKLKAVQAGLIHI